jgi:hypothetical protein
VKLALPWLAGCLIGIAGPAGAARIIYAGPAWAAVDRGASCAAIARSELIAPRGLDQARASISFDRKRANGAGRRGEVHFRLSRPAGGGAQAMLTVGDEQFLLLTRGADAWSRGHAQDRAIIAAIRRAGDMRVAFRDPAVRRYSDRYLLGGAPTAIDAAAAACSF